MIRRDVIGIFFTGAAFIATPVLPAQSKPKGARKKMQQFAPHPGTIRTIDESDNSVRLTKSDEVPERRRFVYLDKDGREVDASDKATERIPIVEVRITPTDGKGNLVPKDGAQLIRIKEFGPGGRLMRSTTMTPNKPPARH